MPSDETTLVIIGVTGDLSKRKLLPALFNLWREGRLENNLRIVGFARSPHDDDSFREPMKEGLRDLGGLTAPEDEWETFAENLFYVRGDGSVANDVATLKSRLEDMEGDAGTANRMYYLSIAPHLYKAVIQNLSACGLAQEDRGWSRVVIEKPFGQDLASARELNRVAHEGFGEHQIFHIDHYLGKETVQNLMVLRFANAIFEPIWNRNYVENVQVTVAESIPVGDRGAFYDRSGVVRDMIQNHLLQLLTLVAMEPPVALDAEHLRNKKVEVLKAVRKWTVGEAVQNAVSGQYKGYQSEPGVAANSTTPTYACLRLYVDNWRWQGVPFYLRSGKAMERKSTQIVIQFRCPPQAMFSSDPSCVLPPNSLSLCIQPDEGIHLKFDAKVPGEGMFTNPVDMEFHYADSFKDRPLAEAYERLLQDALAGDASLFIRSDHIEEAWRIVDPLLEAWGNGAGFRPHVYEPGSWGPEAADRLLAENGHAWVPGCVHD
jgi:glucose-6-phosphate 1-dehydrogenase